MLKKELLNFQLELYDLTSYTSVLSKARCRVFYKYGNRNGAYITDEFAQQLLSTITYTPIKGLFLNDDFTGHNMDKQVDKIYGIVPKDYNFAWEEHLDKDGVTRVYACVDVLLYTALYEEAKDIVNKTLSLELYRPTVNGTWEIINGEEFFVYSSGSFLGLQVLGDDREPCFEGAGFYSYTQVEELRRELKEFTTLIEAECNPGGNVMKKKNLQANVEDTKEKTLSNTEEPVENTVEVEEEEKTETEDTNTEPETEEPAEDNAEPVTEEEEKTEEENVEDKSETDPEPNYEKVIEEKDEEIKKLKEKNEEFEIKFSTLTKEKDDLKAEYETLRNEKITSDRLNKKSLIEEYELLPKDVAEEFSKNLAEGKYDEFELEDLDKELAYALVKSNGVANFENKKKVVKVESEKTGLFDILERYEHREEK